ncbi:MAG: aldo/keto reductase [Dehalococcoidia bacterium]|jgi:aryl-alcohol dehydrogenase-like predicted oxidoreductase
MEYRSFGRTGVKVSSLCLGCMMFGGKTDPAESQKIIDRALDAGINFIDTANVYNLGKSEEATGEALKRNGKRGDVVLATKVHWKMGEGANDWGNSRRHIIEQCEASLRRLQTDYIDLYQIHRPQPDIPIDEALRTLDDLVHAGKVRYIGSSTFAAWQVVESLWVAKELGLNRFVSEQPPYNLLDRRIERELLPMARTFGLAVIPWSPLAGGLLTGKYRRGEEPPAGSRFEDYENNPLLRHRMTERIYDVVEGLQPLAEEKGITLSQLALAWCMQRTGVTSPIIGPRTLEQLEDNLGALEVTFSEDELKRIDRIARRGDAVAPFYEADFGPHPHRI